MSTVAPVVVKPPVIDAVIRVSVRRDSMLTRPEREASFDALIEYDWARPAHYGGFTEWALGTLLDPDTGGAVNARPREWYTGGPDIGIRLEGLALGLAYRFYTGREDLTHLWVRHRTAWHLVHRKGHS